ncbi:nucleoside triphosphate pyrophosphohydrolase [Candidatus Saccharibacteria bacterium]|nr:nucleoside triphosphate pyrophosphohydrolase [Candidatus Saccharibacteria bacterium]
MSDVTEVNKLVSDNTPEILASKGITAKFHEADHDQYEIELLEKLREEVLEFKNNKSIVQLSDLLITVDAVVELHGWGQEDVLAAKAERLNEKGGYSKRLILEQTE